MVTPTSNTLLLTLYAPMMTNTRINGASSGYGTLRSFTHSPISGRLRTRSMMLPMYMEAIKPQNTSGFSATSKGPGLTPWISSAAKITAIEALPGIPSVSNGINELVAALLFADSGAATPSIAPLPNRSGCLLSFFSSAYEMNDEMIAPPPGSTPIKNPSNDPRAMGAADVRHSSRFGSRPRMVV